MTPKSTYITTLQDILIDKRLSDYTKFMIKYENYAEKPFVGQFTRGAGDAERQLCVLFIVALVFNRNVKGRQGFAKQLSPWKIKEHFNSLEWFKITICKIQCTDSNSQAWGYNSLILPFRRQRLVVSEFTLNWPNSGVQVSQGYITQRS